MSRFLFLTCLQPIHSKKLSTSRMEQITKDVVMVFDNIKRAHYGSGRASKPKSVVFDTLNVFQGTLLILFFVQETRILDCCVIYRTNFERGAVPTRSKKSNHHHIS